AAHPFRGPFISSYWAGNESVRRVRERVTKDQWPTFLDALYSNANSGADLLFFNEGDTSGIYTHALYVNSIAFTDSTLSDSAISALGGAKAAGIFVPEPGSSLLLILSCAGLAARRRRA
ncbi:MAG: PEP-CTERM sorting domain-containing protein, partial [Verrucomicrobiaceae bacterium]